MTRAEYLSASAKLFSVSSFILFVANILIFAGKYNEAVGAYGNTISRYTFYIIAVLCFLSLNGEGVGYKRHRDFGNKKKTIALKFLLLFVFIIRYMKKPVETLFLSFIGGEASAVIVKLFLGLFNTVASFSFLFTMVSLLYMMRDFKVKKVFVFEAVAFISGTVYAFFRSVSYSVTKYELTELGNIFTRVFSNQDVLTVMGIVQYFLFVVMCLFVMNHYNSLVLGEQDEKIKERKKMLVAPKIYNTDHLGMDTPEDNYLLPRRGEED